MVCNATVEYFLHRFYLTPTPIFQTRTLLIGYLQKLGGDSQSLGEGSIHVVRLKNDVLTFLSKVDMSQLDDPVGTLRTVTAAASDTATMQDYFFSYPSHTSVIQYCNGGAWDISNHPRKDLLEVRTYLENGSINHSDIVIKRPQEYQLEVKLDAQNAGVYDKEIKIFDCEYLWKTTRNCIGRLEGESS